MFNVIHLDGVHSRTRLISHPTFCGPQTQYLLGNKPVVCLFLGGGASFGVYVFFTLFYLLQHSLMIAGGGRVPPVAGALAAAQSRRPAHDGARGAG